MPDTQNETRHAITYIEAKPCLELSTSEYIFPINTPDDRFTLRCHMRPYEPYAVKKFYDQVIPRRKRRTQSEASLEIPDYSEVREFVAAHFNGFDGATLADGTAPTIEQQRQWLAENNTFAERIFRDGYDRLGPRMRQDGVPKGAKGILLFGAQESRVQMEMRLYSLEIGRAHV